MFLSFFSKSEFSLYFCIPRWTNYISLDAKQAVSALLCESEIEIHITLIILSHFFVELVLVSL